MNDKEMQWSFVAPQREDMPAIQAYKEEFETHHQLLHGTSDSTELETVMAAVPNRTFLLKDGEGEIVGMGNIRLGLNLYLYEQAGHIGYSIRPARQRQGYGKILLSQLLSVASFAGMEKVLIVCKRDNLASRRLIESLEPEKEKSEDPELCRYWIFLETRKEA